MPKGLQGFQKRYNPWNKNRKMFDYPQCGFQKGCIPWSKGLTKETDERIRKSAIKASQKLKGRIAWNKNRKMFDYSQCGFQKGHPDLVPPKARKRAGEKMKGKKLPPHSLIAKVKMRKRKIEFFQNPINRKKLSGKLKLKWQNFEYRQRMIKAHQGYIMPQSQKDKIREGHVNNPNTKFKNTSIELKVEEELKRRKISYQTQHGLGGIAIVDFYLPEYRIVIQCDGDYWHNFPEQKERDERQDKVLISNGVKVHRFWQHEINQDVKNV